MTDRIDILDKGYVRLVDHMGSDLSIVNAARVSYDKESAQFSERDERLINFLIRENHTSPLRHATLCYEIYAPLMVARQWWKYTVASTHVDDQNGWNESSRRYVTENEEFHIPDSWRSAPENLKQGSGPNIPDNEANLWSALLADHYERGNQLYDRAMRSGIAPEQARLFLPAYGMYVRWRWTTSLAGALHFISQRVEHDAQYEIRQYAIGIRDITRELFPATFAAVGL